MSTLPQLNTGREKLASYSVDSEEEISEALVEAFLAANINAFNQASTLSDWVDVDALEAFREGTDCQFRISTQIWYHTVVITPEEITIYTSLPAQ